MTICQIATFFGKLSAPAPLNTQEDVAVSLTLQFPERLGPLFPLLTFDGAGLGKHGIVSDGFYESILLHPSLDLPV